MVLLRRCGAAFAGALIFFTSGFVPVRAAEDAATAAMVAQATTGTIAGTVTNAAGGTVRGARVTVEGPMRTTASTDAAGAFALSVPPGVYRVLVTEAGYRDTAQTDVVVAANETQTLNVALSAIDLSSLRTIGTVTAGRGGTSINTSAATQTVISAAAFANYPSAQINDVLQRVPDVVIQKLGTQQDQSIVVGGLQPYETQVLIDGHPIALGQYGVWFTQYFPSFLIGGVETQSGPGNTTPFANIAVGGTANIQTPAFTSRTTQQVNLGYDNWRSQNVNAVFTGKLGNLSYVLGAGVAGQNGYYFKKSGCDVYTPSPGPTFAGSGPGPNQPGYAGIIAFCGDFSGSLFNKGSVYKLKYDFSPATSVEFGFLGSYGGYSPQGSSWGNSLGPTTIINCVPGTQYCNNPQYSNLVGKTINAFFWYPGTQIYSNQQLWTGQFRTSFGSNSLLIRPYIGTIEPESYDGGQEKGYPAFFSPDSSYPACPKIGPAGSFGPEITCYAGPASLAPGATVPASGLANPNSFENYNCPPGNIFAFQQINSPVNTTTTVGGRQLCYQYPYTTFEKDTLYGTTVSFVHPIGEGYLDLTYDYHGQSTFAYANAPENVQVPYSATRYSTVSLTGDIRSIPKLSIPFGIYNTSWTANGSIIDGGGNVTGGLQRYETHVDPHVAFVFRPNTGNVVRAAFGTSTTYPFIGDLSGAAAYQPPASGFSSGLLTFKTPSLQPEHSLAYSLGADHRFGNGSLISLDLTDTVVHNVFQQIGSVDAGDPGLGLFTPLNIARLEARVATLKYAFAPRTGFGYNISMAADRSITSGVPPSAMTPYPFTLPANNVQICGNGLFTPGTATCVPYLKGYGQLTYTARNGAFIGLGADYEGKNNAYYQPPFAVFDFAARAPIARQFDLGVTVQNLFNTNSYNYLPAPNLGVPVTSNYSTDGKTVQQGSYPTYLIPAATRTLRLQLRAHVGRS